MHVARALAIAVPLLGLALGTATGHGVKRKTLAIDHPMAFEWQHVGDTVAVYMTIANTGTRPDRLIGAESPMATRITLHDAGLPGRQAEVEAKALDIAPGARLALVPSGAKLRLHGVKRVPVAWDTFPMTLVLERAGRVTVDVLVEESGAPGR